MDKFKVASALKEIARYLELSDPNPFRARAFEKAARAVEGIEGTLTSASLTSVPGIGKATASIIEELLQTGKSAYLDELRAQYPAGIFELMRVPKLGLTKVGQLYKELGIGSLDELEAAARAGKLAALKGFGAKTQQTILDGIAFARVRESRFLLPVGLEVGEMIRERLAGIAEIEDAEITGSVRRRLEIIRNVNVTIATKSPAKVIAAIRESQLVADLKVWKGSDPPADAGAANDGATAYAGRVRNEIDVIFHFALPKVFGTALLTTTGSAEFLAAWPGKKIPHAATEEEVFKKAGVVWVAPERRENGDDLKLRKPRPLVELAALRGTFHVHTTYSDGRNTLAEMLNAAREHGFEYLGLSDHSKAASYAGGLTEERLKMQRKELDGLRPALEPMRVFHGSEADILADGSIDYGAKTLDQFDFVVASVHSRFSMPKDEMTERILTALDDPHVTFLGHMTGRKLLTRDGYTFDYDRVFERAGERGVMIEINGNPNRLDIDWRLVRRALDRGVRFSIHPDAHSIREYGALLTGTWVARKAGLSAKEIFNTQPLEAVAEHLASRRPRRKAEGGRQRAEGRREK
jgi:DNA polymerase (family 10)